MSTLLWIAVPGGITSGRALLRVLVVPKLDGGSLSQHGMAQWPPIELRQGTVRTEVHPAGATSETPPVFVRDLTPSIPFQSGLWEQLVDGLTVENAPAQQAAVHPASLTVYPTSADARAVDRTLNAAFTSQVTKELGAQSPDFTTKVRDALVANHGAAAEPPVDRRRPRAAPPPPPPTDPAGFHRTLSMLREHPAVLRALGLIFELHLDADAVSALAGGTVRVVWPDRPARLPTVVSLRTQFSAEFLPGSTPSVDAGMVRLDRLDATGSRRWEVVPIDVDVATQRLREAARAMTARPDEPVTLPALRSGGLQLLLRGRGEEMVSRIARAARAREAQPDVLTADDLILGYRIDVLPQLGGSDWFSLHQRAATYRLHRRLATGEISQEFTLVGTEQAVEEGHLKTNAAIHDDSGLHADEIVAAWRGWSLSVPRPSFEQAARPVPPTRPSMTVSMSFEAAAGSLPRLRFGQFYTLRARVADIAGGGLGPDDPVPERYQTPPIFYGRYEPVLAPDVALPEGTDSAMLDPGEAVEHVVVRSDPTVDLGIVQYAARFGYRLDDKRLLLPPTTTQAIAEQHGKFDGAPHTQTWDWARRAFEGKLSDPAAGGIAVVEVTPGAAAVSQRRWDGQWPDLQPKMLQLTDRPSGHSPVGWEDGRLVVRLAPAEQITLQLSTFPRDGIIDEFALHDADPPAGSMEAARLGRHPLLSPARTVTFVHAVQRPLRIPDTALNVQRERGQTIAALAPSSPSNSLPLLDPKSTAQLDVTACWDDQVDNVPTQVADAPVTTVTIRPDDSPNPATLFRHEFGDTRHRTVRYTLRAVSRFCQYFRDSDPSAFVRTSTPPPVVIPSSSPPPPPVVLSATPAFEWVETGNLDSIGSVLKRQRLGTRVRLTLQPPWHSSGAGELLAVVVRPDSGGIGALDDVVSQAGHDPIYPSFGLLGGGPFARDITSGTGEQRTLRIGDDAATVVIKPHEPTYHSAAKCWLCDVALTPAFDHTLVQLAVARYQPHSLDGLWLSDVIKTDVVPLLPERTLYVTRQAGKFEIKLVGAISSANAVNRVDVILERCRRPAGMSAEQVDLIGFRDGPDDVPAWVPFQSRSPAPTAAGLGNLKQWTANFFIGPEWGELRVRVREVELIPNATAQPGVKLKSCTPGEVTERTVFTDTVILPVI